jgi:carbamate kinase
MLAVQSAGDPALTHPYPFDVLDAQTQGMIGYWLVQELDGVAGKHAACLLRRTLVKADDPAFSQPAKFVGQVYDEASARRLAAEHGWQVRPDEAAWRRVVPSPEPAEILELDTIKLLSSCGRTVICAGGGGIPVVPGCGDQYRGVEAPEGRSRLPVRGTDRRVRGHRAAG